MMLSFRIIGVSVAALALVAQSGSAEEPLDVAKPSQAREFAGRTIRVEMVVRSSKKSVEHKKLFLDSNADFRQPDNLGIAISEQAGAALEQKNMTDDLAVFLLGKRIRVVGQVALRDGRTYIDVADPKQIDLVKPIPVAEARKYDGKTITVEMDVQASKKSGKFKRVFLDSHENFQAPENLGIAITEEAASKLATENVTDDLPAFYLRKKIRVTGKVDVRDERTYIDVDDPEQIEILKETS